MNSELDELIFGTAGIGPKKRNFEDPGLRQPAKRSRHKKSRLFANLRADQRKQNRRIANAKEQRQKSDYLDTVGLEPAEPVRKRVIPSAERVRPRMQRVNQNIIGSRNDIQTLKEHVQLITNRVKHANTKLKTRVNSPELNSYFASLNNAETDLNKLPRLIDRAVSASSTMALVEGRNWRTVPHCLVHGLVHDHITVERNAELITRLNRTPLKNSIHEMDETAYDQVEQYSEALAAEIKTVNDETTPLETLQQAQDAVLSCYEQAILQSTKPQTLARTERYAELKAARSLMKFALRMKKKKEKRKPVGSVDVPLEDPSQHMTPIPEPAHDPDQGTSKMKR